MEDKKNMFLDYMVSTFEDIVQNDFSQYEKENWNKCMKYYNSNFRDFFSAIYDSIDTDITIDSKITEPALSFSNKHNLGTAINEFYEKQKPNKKIDTNFYILLYKMNFIYQEKINLEFQDTEHLEKILRLQNKTILLGQRHNASRELIDIDIPSIRTFFPNEDCRFNYTTLRLNLKKNGFISENSEVDSFNAIYSINKISSKFNKISWLGSLLELKYFIRILIEKGVIFNDVNYKHTIADCFLKDEKVIKIEQLDSPSGSNKNFDTIIKIVETSIMKK
jgi:hypothetical protein